MAEEESTEESQPQAEEKKSSNVLMIVIIAVLILIILIGGAVGILLMGDDEEVEMSQPVTKEKSVSKSKRSSASSNYDDSRLLNDIGILYPLDTFTVNLKSDAGRRYLKVTMSLELEGEELSLELDAKSPVLRDRIIRILTSKTLEEISSKKGKQKISTQIMDTLNAMISDGTIRG
ncbi:MAG: flagellar basal body-associated FliL family protein, partial [Campylobacterota bacterium]|nr:flagellar basal body-associated FliL family protein [Campylobacterota bacterium]